MVSFKNILFVLFLVSQVLSFAQSPRAALAPKPPMGWNSWNKFQCDVSEKLIKEMADALVSSGMKDAGYEYIVIDDCWQVSRDGSGNIVADASRFPSGIKALADYVHSKGLKFGIYTDAGTKTCQNRPGSLNYEEKDINIYAAWGVDYIKVDWCNTSGLKPKDTYARWGPILDDASRPILFSICNWGIDAPWIWGRSVGGQMWRTTHDILNCWDCTLSWGGAGWIHILDKQVGLEKYSGPGGWNDPDMLQVGNGGMNDTEDRAHFSLWAILAAPLMAGNDIKNMSAATREILTNKEVIAVDQDPLGKQGTKVRDYGGGLQVWSRQLHDGSRAVALLNRSSSAANITANWSDIGISGTAHVRDLWAHADRGSFTGSYTANVPSHGVVMVKAGGINNSAPAVNLTAPSDNTTAKPCQPVILKAEAKDPDGSISKVDFFVNGLFIGTSATAPYSFSWNAVPGEHSITAQASDNLDLISNSSAVKLTVKAEAVASLTSNIDVNGKLDETDWKIDDILCKDAIGIKNNDIKFQALWDHSNLYIGARIMDADLHSGTAYVWENDAVEIYIDGNNNKGSSYDAHDI